MHTDTYICYACGHDIVDHVYLVQRRTVRPVPLKGSPEYKTAPKDAVHTWHGGIILGPERDPYCSSCYTELSTVQNLLDSYKDSLKKT